MPNSLTNAENVGFNNGQNIADEFNSYFINSINDLPSNFSYANLNNTLQNFKCNSIFLSPVITAEINKILSKLPNKRSAGFDAFPCYLLKEIADLIDVPLAHLVNISFSLGHFPNYLKQAAIVPVHKKHAADKFENYRPITILPAFSKVFK